MSLGADLRAAREQAGLSLETVSERTRIRQTVIARIEADDFSLCGGDVYARGHIRTLARVAGTDPEPLVNEFDRLHAPQPPTAAEVFEAETQTTRERRGPNWTAAMAAAVVVLLAIAGFQLLRGGGSPATTAGGGASQLPAASFSSSRPAPSASTVSTPPASTTSPSPTLVARATPSGGVTVRLAVSGGKSWVSATTAGGKTLYEGILSNGSTRTFSDPKLIKLVLGNAGAVHLVVNGVDLGSPGTGASVARLSFGPGDPNGQG